MAGNEPCRLHFDFAHLSDQADYSFRHSLFSVPLQAHDEDSRAHARSAHAMLRLVPDRHLTHFVDVDLPDSHVALLYVTTPRQVGGKPFDHPVHMAIHVPAAGREIARAAALAARGDAKATLHAKLARYAPAAPLVETLAADGVDPQFPAHIDDFQTALDAAQALLFHHGNLVNLNASDGGSIPAFILQDIHDALAETWDLVDTIQDQGGDWLVATPVGETVSLQPSALTLEVASGPLGKALLRVQNNLALEGEQWRPRYGVSSAPYGGTAEVAPSEPAKARIRPDAVSGGDKWSVKMISDGPGLSVDADSIVYTPPAATPDWKAQGHWSSDDSPPLTPALAAALVAGKVRLRISDAGHPDGLLEGKLVAGAKNPDTLALPFSVTLAAVAGVTGDTTAATATFSLNGGQTGLSYMLTLAKASGTAGAGLYDEEGNLLFPIELFHTAGTGSLTFECTNKWLRHLSLCVEYLDVDGRPLEPVGWDERLPSALRKIFQPDSKKPFVDLIGPVATVFGVPLPPDATSITVPIWDQVHTLRFHFGGLGRGAYDSEVCPIGITVTALAEMALPVFLLAAGTAVTNSKTVRSLMADRQVLLATCYVGTLLAGATMTAVITNSQDPKKAVEGMSERFAPLMLSLTTALGKWVYLQMAKGAAERAIPFIDIGLAIVNAAVTAAQLTQTSVEVLDSPFVYKADITRSMDLELNLVPDPRYNKFPDYHDTLHVTVLYDSGATTAVFSKSLPPTTLSDPIKVKFESIPVAGNIRVIACFKAANGWQSGQALSTWIPAIPTGGVLKLGDLIVTTNKIPLSQASVYIHQEKIGMVDGKIGWIASVDVPPTQTAATDSPFLGDGKAVLRGLSITTAQEPEMIGYCWEAKGLGLSPDTPGAPVSNGNLYTVQNLSVLEHPDAGYSHPAVGFTAMPGIAYNMVSKDGDATNFFIDPSQGTFDPDTNPTGGFHLRSLPLSHAGPPPVFAVSSGQSYGRFPEPLDRYVYHPQGHVFGISYAYHKLFRVTLPAAPVEDGKAVMATMSSGEGIRDGMMNGPVGIAVALDGRILVLESVNKRIQAFDTDGNCVPYFANPAFDPSHAEGPGNVRKIPTCALQPREGSTYLDLSVESEGYLYVLSHTGGGDDPAQYHLDLYKPDGSFLVTTPNVAAARIVVNILRDLYTLNYEQFLDASGRVQPSISMWLPPPPAPVTPAVRTRRVPRKSRARAAR